MKKTLLFLSLSLFVWACGEDPVAPNEEEVITTLNLTLTPVGGGTAVEFAFQDLDGDGGNAPTITNGTLAANTDYTATVEFLNEAETPAEDITEEVVEEGLEHQVFYEVTGANLTFTYTDEDSEGNPIGITTDVAAGDAGNGTLTVTLRHEPAKDAAGVSDGMIANAGGESDIEVEFSIVIQ